MPVDTDGGLWLVEQYRYPVEGRSWEFPQGSWEQQPGVDPAVLARGELREKAGLEAGSLRRIGHLYEAYGFSTQGFDVWLASELEQVPVSRHTEEQDMRVRRIARDEWEAMVRGGKIKDAPSVAAYGLLLLSGLVEVCSSVGALRRSCRSGEHPVIVAREVTLRCRGSDMAPAFAA